MPRNENSIIWEQFTSHQLRESTHSKENSCKDDEVYDDETHECKKKVEEDNDHDFDSPHRTADREKVQGDPAFKQKQGKTQTIYNINKCVKELSTANFDDITDPDLLNSVYLKLKEAKDLVSPSHPYDKANAEYDAMEVDDPNHWQNSGGRPPGY
jgi:hypothetical protein